MAVFLKWCAWAALALLALAASRRAAGDCDGTRLEVWDGAELADSETLGWLGRRFPAAVETAR